MCCADAEHWDGKKMAGKKMTGRNGIETQHSARTVAFPWLYFSASHLFAILRDPIVDSPITKGHPHAPIRLADAVGLHSLAAGRRGPGR
jgi:hypothetical protein